MYMSVINWSGSGSSTDRCFSILLYTQCSAMEKKFAFKKFTNIHCCVKRLEFFVSLLLFNLLY